MQEVSGSIPLTSTSNGSMRNAAKERGTIAAGAVKGSMKQHADAEAVSTTRLDAK